MDAAAETTIVVAYQNEPMRRLLTRIFEGEGHRVISYSSTKSFLDSSPKGEPACLVLEIPPEDLNDSALLGQLLTLSTDNAVVAVTMDPEVARLIRRRSRGHFGVVELPIEAGRLFAVVSRIE